MLSKLLARVTSHDVVLKWRACSQAVKTLSLFLFFMPVAMRLATAVLTTFGNEKGAGAEILPAMVSGIVAGDAPVSYWPIFFFVPGTVPEVCAKVNLTQFPSGF